jgi:hypothetical protein
MFTWMKRALQWAWGVRDTILELVIIVMIGWEIHEGNRQYELLEKMNKNTADTVCAMEELRKEQAESLTAMNKTFGEAVTAMKSQLAILQTAQQAQLREQSKHAEFKLCIKALHHGGCAPVGSQEYFSSDQSGYSVGTIASVIFDLTNTGDKDGTNVKLSLTADPEYTLECQEVTVERIPKPVEGGSVRILANLGTIRAGKHKSVRCSATKGGLTIDYVRYLINVEADQLPPDGQPIGKALILNSHDPSVIKSLPPY